MDLKLYYLIQDVAGIFIGIYGIKLVILGFLHIVKKGFNISKLLFLLADFLIILAGAALAFNEWGIKWWIVCILLILLNRIINSFAYRIKTKIMAGKQSLVK
ncbi:hypothetical protein CLHOM_09630 [Clostridium homopropionicum DSM 5847]|uniref:Uncharacterized protein n=1 Tax=Clostridium homopropionicum DSM 5847 TaxID=1121318 RepID=A0A0L6ZCX2_9CLOT|nr:hypothetical protein [Clostridium homopropionicum]KOA20820.1 hypothetical protein CLHOM_09630 [Clostridium homopropionicum DSM 5847]SFF88312.1 hypothetical protein SAMN04488501_10334 [Clostridium homopropionicum]